MRRSQLFIKTRREAPADEESKNARLLIRAGFIHKDAAGVYALPPLGLAVVENIKRIVRDEMNKSGGNELLMTSLQRQELWQHTDRWDDATKKLWRRIGYLEAENTRTKQMMRMSTRMLDDIEANRDRLDILKCVTQIEHPILVIHGARDEGVPVSESAEIASYADDASHVVIANASHTYNAIHPLVHVPFDLTMAAAVTARFISVYS